VAFYRAMSAKKAPPEARKSKQPSLSLPDLVARYLRTHAAAKRGYERADRLLDAIAARVKPGEEFPLADPTQRAVLVDRFSGKSKLGAFAFARRWELKFIEGLRPSEEAPAPDDSSSDS
jgi:hypothetical protein